MFPIFMGVIHHSRMANSVRARIVEFGTLCVPGPPAAARARLYWLIGGDTSRSWPESSSAAWGV
jgi:hypothetical protein